MIVNQRGVLNNFVLSYFSNKVLKVFLVLTHALKMKHPYTYEHSLRVAQISYTIAKQMRLPDQQCIGVYAGGLLHDIGKLGVSENILNKPSKLEDDEFQIIQKHPEYGFEILKNINCFEKSSILDSVLYHHEKYDGSGYPKKVKNKDIPLVARIIAVADSFDAMVSSRAYQSEQSLEYALNEIYKNKGIQFDPEVADAFLDVFEIGKTNQLEREFS